MGQIWTPISRANWEEEVEEEEKEDEVEKEEVWVLIKYI